MPNDVPATGNALQVLVGTNLPVRTVEQAVHSAKLDTLAEAAADASRSKSTRRMYAWCWNHFVMFCSLRGLEVLPASPATVKRFLTALAVELPHDPTLPSPPEGYSDPTDHRSSWGYGGSNGVPKQGVKSINMFRSALIYAHESKGFPSPCVDPGVKEVMKGIRRIYGKKVVKVKPLTLDLLERVVEKMPDTLAGVRDRAMLTLLYAACLRRDELCHLTVENFVIDGERSHLEIDRSKTDKIGQGASVPLHRHTNAQTCPVQSVQAWLALSGVNSGRLFRSFLPDGMTMRDGIDVQSVARILQKWLGEVLSPEEAKAYSGHSPRRGLITDVLRNGASVKTTQKYSRHKTAAMVFEYQEEAKLHDDDEVSRMFKDRVRPNKEKP